MQYKCPQCGHVSAEAGNCPMCNVPMPMQPVEGEAAPAATPEPTATPPASEPVSPAEPAPATPPEEPQAPATPPAA